MKNSITIFSVLFAMLVLNGQLLAQSSIFGVRGGVNFSTYNDNPMSADVLGLDKSFMAGIDVAAFAKLKVAGAFSVQPELQFIQKGIKYTTSTNSNAKLVEKVNYLEIPVLARVDAGSGPVTFNAYVGPSVGYAVSGKIKGEDLMIGSEASVISGEFEEDITWDDDFGTNGIKDNRWDVSGVAGVGVAYDVGPVMIVLDGRFNMDFTDRIVYENTPNPTPDKYFHRGIAITAGVAVPLGGMQ